MIKFPNRFIFLGLVLALGSAVAGPLPISESATGLYKMVDVIATTSSPYYLDKPAGMYGYNYGAGGFTATVEGQETVLWCVDSQLWVATSPLRANVVLIEDIPAADANPSTVQPVRYGDVGVVGSWTNDLSAILGVADPNLNTAKTRFSLAAYLISQYSDTDSDGFGPDAKTATDKAIQRAIWTITHNNSMGSLADTAGYSLIHGAAGTTDPTTERYWIEQAYANLASVQLDRWAVVSWVALDASGALSTRDDIQTMLVQVVPEPGFYGLLALGLAGIVLRRYRRA